MGMLIAIVVGAVLGGLVLAGLGGGVVGGAIGWLFIRSQAQQRELESLRSAIALLATQGDSAARPAREPAQIERSAQAAAAQLEASASAPAPRAFETDDGYAQVVSVPLSVVPLVSSPFVASTPASESDAAAASAASPVSRPVVSPTPPPPNPLWLAAKQWLFGGNTIVKAGVAILFIGLAFLARYASEHAQLAIEWRLAAIGATAVVLLAIGWRLRLTRPGYAQVLQGGAVAVLYLTLFAAFRYYGVLAALPAFVTMVAIALLAAALAVLQDARALAVIGALGGFATPLLVSTGSGNQIALFSYYLVLDVGIAAVAWFRTWRSINLIGFVATFGVAGAWGVLRYEPSQFASSEAFLIAFFLLFVMITLLPARRLARATANDPLAKHDRWVNSSLLFGLPTAAFAMQYGLVRDMPFGPALSALALGGFYVLLATAMRRRAALLGLTFDASLAIASVFLTMVIPFALDARSTAGAWSIEGAALVWIGFRQQRPWPRVFGYALLLMAAGAMLFGHDRFGDPDHVFNAYLFNGLMAAAASIAAAYFVQRERVRRSPGADPAARPGADDALEAPLIAIATLWLLSTLGLQLSTVVPPDLELAVALAGVSLIAAAYAALSARLGWVGIALPAIAHAPLMFLAAAGQAVTLAQPAAQGGWWAWPITFAAHAVVLALAVPRWTEAVRAAGHATRALGPVTLAVLGALLGRALTAGWGDDASAWPWLGWLVAPALLLFLLPHPVAARWWPIRTEPAAYRRTAAAALAAGLWLWTLVANLASDGSAAPLPHVPLINPLDLGIATALVAIGLWLRRTGSVERRSLTLVGIAAFVWLNAILLRTFRHYGGVPYDTEAWADSLAVQTGITLLWTVLALVAMWLAARRAARWPWIVGAGLLSAVVAKLLLVDLAGSGSVMRIVSFIGVGVLMLLIGYVAPLPARSPTQKEADHAPTA